MARGTSLRISFAFPFFNQSGWADLNRRPPRPKRGALAVCATPRADKSIIRSMLKRQDLRSLPQASPWKLIGLAILIVLSACQSNPSPYPSASPKPSSTITQLMEEPQPSSTETQRPQLSNPPTASPSPTANCLTLGGELHKEAITSDYVGELSYQIYLPPCYQADSEKRYPVLYLLHGLSYDEEQWLQLGLIQELDALIAEGEIAPFIVVLPRETRFEPPQISGFDDALVMELVPWIDMHYQTFSEKPFRGLGGLSRGAAWAVRIGLTHYQLFNSIGAHSLPLFEADGGNISAWLTGIPQGNLPSFFIDIGRSDQEVQSALDFANLLDAHHVPHEWHLFNGGHTQAYWSSHLKDYLKWYARDW
jgi:enterochelin esterase-like enzyme